MRGLALFIAIIFLIVNSGCTYTQKGIIKEDKPAINISPQLSEEDYFIAKHGSLLFHKPHCKFLRAKGYLFDSKDIIIFKTKREALRAHYTPCLLCKPDSYEADMVKEERGWLAVILAFVGLSFLGSSSFSASFNGGEGLIMGIGNE